MNDCETVLAEISDTLSRVYDILLFFKILVLVLLGLAVLGVLFVFGFWVYVFVSLSALLA